MTDSSSSMIMTCAKPITHGGYDAQVHPHPDTPQVYRYAIQAFQPYLKLSKAKGIAAEMIPTVLFAATTMTTRQDAVRYKT